MFYDLSDVSRFGRGHKTHYLGKMCFMICRMSRVLAGKPNLSCSTCLEGSGRLNLSYFTCTGRFWEAHSVVFYVSTHARTPACTHARTHAHQHARMHAHTHAHTQGGSIYRILRVLAGSGKLILSCFTCLRTPARPHARTHALMHTSTHACTHTRMLTRREAQSIVFYVFRSSGMSCTSISCSLNNACVPNLSPSLSAVERRH